MSNMSKNQEKGVPKLVLFCLCLCLSCSFVHSFPPPYACKFSHFSQVQIPCGAWLGKSISTTGTETL